MAFKRTKKIRKKNKTQPTEEFILRTPKGMHDVLPSEQPYWDRINKVIRSVAELYGFGEIRTPILEFALLFQKTAGQATDLIEKEMYLLKTRGGDLLALRPEGTAPVARAYLEHKLGRVAQPQKLYYLGPMFRHENPQLGRYRELTQVGFEILGGANDALYDAQIIAIFRRILAELKIKNVKLKINSIGCRSCRPQYLRLLQNYYSYYEKEICADCSRRLKVNPFRLLDCNKEACKEIKEEAPNILDKLCSACSRHLKDVLEYLDEIGIAYELDNYLVRGLDYYNRTVFEFFAEEEKNNVGALLGGGRYDYLIEFLGGKSTPAVGGAAGIERLIVVMKSQEIVFPQKSSKKIFVAHVGGLAKKKAFTLIERLRQECNVAISEMLSKDSLKAQLKVADRESASLALILGQKEIYEENVIIRDLQSGLQETVPLSNIVEEIKKRL